ncbi:LysR family transcriptional regulator substrate-binding protein [Nocardioides sp. B-3]|uniref:LysR family transcriptional regulator substrate-binding protein n=1 Tax=Nocardioides sp. B-3 TaxID=2895565 RepID=UPI0021539635|nr:LysR family transcriptional regulator substrate-binding protein [Nocardioides sp. B-3]UUZ59702.1 LysR family transcriptional regulator substrate-binding protein [Nocardioides sp. B-3]
MGEDPFRVVFPESWGRRLSAPYPAEQLADLSRILHHPGSSDAAIFDAFFARWDLHPRVVAHSDDFHATLALVGAGLGAALVPDLALREIPPRVVVADVAWFNISRSIFALVHPDRVSAGLSDLLDGVAASLAPDRPRNDAD